MAHGNPLNLKLIVNHPSDAEEEVPSSVKTPDLSRLLKQEIIISKFLLEEVDHNPHALLLGGSLAKELPNFLERILSVHLGGFQFICVPLAFVPS